MRSILVCFLLSGAALAACGKKAPAPDPVADAAVVAAADTAAPPTTAPPTKDPAPEDAGAPPTVAADDAAASTAPPADDAAQPTVAVDDAAQPTAAADDAAAPAADDAAAPAADDAAPTKSEADGVAGNPDWNFTPVSAPPKKFDEMSKEEQKNYMKEVVVPAMRERFQKYNPVEFAKVNCATCHGKNPQDRKFEMPNADLTKLPTTKEGFEKLLKEEPEGMEFMGKVVLPTMATLLGEEPYNPQTQKGFGCMECHTQEKE